MNALQILFFMNLSPMSSVRITNVNDSCESFTEVKGPSQRRGLTRISHICEKVAQILHICDKYVHIFSHM